MNAGSTVSLWYHAKHGTRGRTAVLLLLVLIALPALLACTGDELSTTTSSAGTTGSSEDTTDGSTDTTESTETGDSETAEQAYWGPLPLTAGSLNDLTVRGSVAVGSVSYDQGGGRAWHSYVYALDVDSGRLIGAAEVPGSSPVVDVGTRYAFIWADQGIYIHDLTQDFAYVQTWDDQFVSNFGRYFYVEDPTGPDYLIDENTLTAVTLRDAFQSDRVSDEYIYYLLYPDCVIGDPYALEDGSSDRLPVYSLAENRIIGHVAPGLVSDIAAWDSQRLLAFGTSSRNAQNDTLFAYGLAEDEMVSESTVSGDEGYALFGGLTEGGSGTYYSHGNRLNRVIPDLQPTAGGSYVINGRDGWYALSPSGEIQYVRSGVEAVGKYEGDILAYSRTNESLERGELDGTVSWANDLPEFFGTHPKGPYLTSNSIAWVSSCSGLRGHGDLISQWGYDGTGLKDTEFTGYEVEILSADPFILAMRDRRRGVDGEWLLGGGDASQLPMNLVADIDISYAPDEIHARSTEVTFSCEAKNVPESALADISYEWDVDGAKTTGKEVRHVFTAAGTYTVTVSVKAGGSVSAATKSIEIVVDDPLVPGDFSPTVYPDYYTATGLTFYFACSGLDWDVTRVEWDFGDGTTGTGFTCSHNYTFGEYDATCRLYDASGTLLYEKIVEIYSGYPFFTVEVAPRSGYAPVTVNGSCAPDEGYTDHGLRYSWYISLAPTEAATGTDGEETTTTTDAGDAPRLVSESPSFARIIRAANTYLITLAITDPANEVVHSETFTIVVAPITFSVTDEGRTIQSDASIWAGTRGDPVEDPDGDGLYQLWENAAMELVNPRFELDEGEDLLEHQDTDKVINFVRVSTWPEHADRQSANFVIFYYAISWTKDYGRYYECKLTQGHNGDIEKVVLAFQIIDEYTLDLAWVYTSAHSTNFHGGVWKARGESENTGTIVTPGNIVWGTEKMKASLEFSENALKLYVSEDKHAIYPSLKVGEDVRLLWVGVHPVNWLLDAIAEATDQTWLSTGFVQEDVGEGPVVRLPCYNAGEPFDRGQPDTHLMDDIGWLFKNERIWSGNRYDPSSFAGGLTPQKAGLAWPGSPGTIGGDGLSMPNLLQPFLE